MDEEAVGERQEQERTGGGRSHAADTASSAQASEVAQDTILDEDEEEEGEEGARAREPEQGQGLIQHRRGDEGLAGAKRDTDTVFVRFRKIESGTSSVSLQKPPHAI
jgi:hypothetical protein